MRKYIFLLILFILIINEIISQELIIAPGVYYQKIEQPYLISHIAIIDFPNNNIDIQCVLAKDQVLGRERLSSIAVRNLADLAINGNFFYFDTGEPIGLLVSNGELIRLPIKRGTFGITYDGRAVIDIFNTTISITIDGKSIKVDDLNTPRGGNQIVLYTKRFSKSTMIQKDAFAGINIIIESYDKLPFNGEITGKVVNIEYGVLSSNIPDNGFVISLGGLALKYLPLFSIGKEIKIKVNSEPKILLKEAVSGGPILLKNGENVLGKTNELPLDKNIIDGRHPRTIIGTKQDKIYLIFIEGRKEKSQGVTLKEATEFIKNLGIENALNLDGGGSSNMIIWGNSIESNEREIASALIIKNILPITSPKYLTIIPSEDIYISKEESKKISLILQDENYHKLDIDLGSLTWSISNPIAEFNKESMEIKPKDVGEGKLSISIGGIMLERNIIVYEDVIYINFENEIDWKIKGINYDPLYTTYTISKDIFVEGSKSLSFSYKTTTGNSYIYLEINKPISPKATKISLNIYGDNKNGWLRALFYDSNEKPYVLDLTQYKGINWEREWRLIEKNLNEIKPLISSWNFPPRYPLKLYAIYIVFLNNEGIEGKIYIDDVRIY